MTANLFERILVPTEMNDFGDLALRYALLFNERLASKLTLLYAEEISWLADEHPLGYYIENAVAAKDEIVARMHEFVKTHTPPAAGVETLFVDDTAAHAIVQSAKTIDADLIMMGTHGRQGWSRVMMGSVAERVLRESDVPVLTVRPELLPATERPSIKAVLCPVNFTTIARTALEEATSIAESFDADLIVLHVCEYGDTAITPESELEFADWVDPLIRDHTRYERIFTRGDAASSVLEVAERLRGGLLVIGAQHKRFSDATIIGGTTERITRFARLPVITVVRKPSLSELTAVA